MVVEGVEEVAIELELNSLRDAEALSNTHVPVVNARLAKPSCGVYCHRRRVPAGKQSKLMRCRVLVRLSWILQPGYLVGALKECTLYSADIASCDAVWKTRLKRGNARGFPTADDKVGCTVHAACNLLPTSKRKLIDVVDHESLVNVEVRKTVIQFRMVIVHEALETRAGCANAGSGRLVVLALGPCVDGGYAQSRARCSNFTFKRVVVRVTMPVAVDEDV